MTEEELQASPTWPIVLAFAKRMESKLAKNRHKGDRDGWINDQPEELWDRLYEEAGELYEALEGDSVASVMDEAADVANFAMMIADSFDARNTKAIRILGAQHEIGSPPNSSAPVNGVLVDASQLQYTCTAERIAPRCPGCIHCS